ncbi:MAG: hypothetical protein A4E28_00398 [Methanocella sp. PtaU1.Bin125]|nr:MAG: hypothetical protein A4E28_00398 [Methanocella sp. PtaU1.Bin125]
MDLRKAPVLVLVVAIAASFVTPAGAFIGTAMTLDKHLGDTITFNIGKQVQAAGAAFGLEQMDLGVTWGVDYDLSTIAGYPYGYGGVGALTDANIGYSLGVSMDEAHAAAFDGSPFGVPLATGDMSRTTFNNFIAKNDHISSAQVALPFAGFPVF